jgi:hypothetical protein
MLLAYELATFTHCLSVSYFLSMQDCNMPTALTSPQSRPEAGVHQVDVMEFLGLKRADSLNNKMS